MQDAKFEKGWYVHGLTTGRGVVAVTSGYVAFLPTERPKHLAVEMAWGVAGFVEKGARKIPPEMLLQDLRTADDLDARVQELCDGLRGIRWTVKEAAVKERKIPLRFKHRGLWFLKGKESIRLAKALKPEALATYRALLEGWERIR